MASGAPTTYEELMRQVESLKAENSNLRRELQDNTCHHSRLENDSSSTQSVHMHEGSVGTEGDGGARESERDTEGENKVVDGFQQQVATVEGTDQGLVVTKDDSGATNTIESATFTLQNFTVAQEDAYKPNQSQDLSCGKFIVI